MMACTARPSTRASATGRLGALPQQQLRGRSSEWYLETQEPFGFGRRQLDAKLGVEQQRRANRRRQRVGQQIRGRRPAAPRGHSSLLTTLYDFEWGTQRI